MFRSSEVTNNNNINNNNRQPEIIDGDENYYEFSGATLKITNSIMDNDNNINNQINYFDDENKPAILSGETTPKITTEAEGNNRTTSREISTVELKSKIGSPRHFFCFRLGLFEQAVNDCVGILLKPTNDTDLQGSWLLTEITHWDHEKEKVVILTSKTLLVIKYDFIALRVLEHYKITLNKIDTIVKGKLTYPQSSLVPNIEGISNGISALLKGELFIQQNQQDEETETTKKKKFININQSCGGFKLAQKLNLSHFHPVERNDLGVRLMWNKGQQLTTTQSWNPFAKDIPWRTFSNHPLYGYDDVYNTAPHPQDEVNQNRLIYDVDNFHYALIKLYTNDNISNANINHNCIFDEQPIVLQNYAGLSAVLHNRNNLGFFKVRGKFSF